MKRRDFLKSIGIGAVACVVPSEAIVPKQEMTFKSDKDWGEVTDVAIVDEKGSTLFEEAIEDMVKTPESISYLRKGVNDVLWRSRIVPSLKMASLISLMRSRQGDLSISWNFSTR